jgi:Ca-activated chloride channel family protein
MAVVLDISGSMSGPKLEQAKTSVLQLVERMRDSDQIALITYSDSARIVQPLAPVSAVRSALRITIPTIQIEGGTNIPAGLAMGAMALSSAAENSGLVRRIVLVSDGQDTSGRAIDEVKTEVRQRADQGVTVSTLGIGTDYSESYMTSIADSGRGNYEFLRTGAELANFLQRELQQSNNTTVERAVAKLTLPAGWRVDRAIGAETQDRTGTINLPIGALFAGDERRVVLDLVAPQAAVGTLHDLRFSAQWQAVRTSQEVRVGEGHLAVRTVATDAEAVATRDMTVYAQSESAVLALRQRDAVEAWRQGDVRRAQTIATDNMLALNRLQAAAPSAAPMLQRQAAQYNTENTAFGSIGANSEAGRAFGLSSNVRHRAAQMRSNAY